VPRDICTTSNRRSRATGFYGMVLLAGDGGRSQALLAEYAELLHHGKRVSDAPALDRLPLCESKRFHCLPFGGSPCWFDPLKGPLMGATSTHERYGSVAFTYEPENLFPVVRERMRISSTDAL
jgi:hypothetical protein